MKFLYFHIPKKKNENKEEVRKRLHTLFTNKNEKKKKKKKKKKH